MYQDSVDGTILTVDIGNTNITCGIYQDDKLAWYSRFFSSPNRTADEYFSLLSPLLGNAAAGSVKVIAMASVVPPLTRVWQHLFQKYFQARIVEINAFSPLGLSYKVPDPAIIGGDLIANAYAAWKKYNANCIILDLGTATKIQFVTSTGSFAGAAIAPGLKSSADKLFDSAALLTPIELVEPKVFLGTNTRDALLSGIVHGHAMMLEAYVQKIKLQYFEQKEILTVLTGGIADLVKALVPSADVVDKTLTLDGIYLACRHLLAG